MPHPHLPTGWSVCMTTCAMSLWSSGWYGRNDFVWQWQCWCVWPNIAIVGLYGLTLQSDIPRQDLNWATTTYTNHYPSCTSKFLWCSSPVILQQVYNCFYFFAFWFEKFILYLQLLRISCNFLWSIHSLRCNKPNHLLWLAQPLTAPLPLTYLLYFHQLSSSSSSLHCTKQFLRVVRAWTYLKESQKIYHRTYLFFLAQTTRRKQRKFWLEKFGSKIAPESQTLLIRSHLWWLCIRYWAILYTELPNCSICALCNVVVCWVVDQASYARSSFFNRSLQTHSSSNVVNHHICSIFILIFIIINRHHL